MHCLTADLFPKTRFVVASSGPDSDIEYIDRSLPRYPSSGLVAPVNSPYVVRGNISSRWILTPTDKDTSTPLFFHSAVYFSDHRNYEVDIPALCALNDPVDIIVHNNERYFVIPGWRFEAHQVYKYQNEADEDSALPTLTSADFCLPVRHFQNEELPFELSLTRFLPLGLARWVVKKRYWRLMMGTSKQLKNCLGTEDSIILLARTIFPDDDESSMTTTMVGVEEVLEATMY
ncbi:hypothetical protein GSI_01626 [Ganoderma sinense ZZ0214-1]|uniref:Uncharacterized protein n=1 Tax=Ganoderma sinense ZZ0214-1 TaxID=1077348 RepID=A0A2G8SQC2_9APHY|nr:hypothetical protein GSI_01626 [Ganoderma sinense ZZ0214-1]